MSKERQFPRHAVCFDAQVKIKNNLVVGSVLDLSEKGAFFRPEAGVMDGLFTQLNASFDSLAIDDQVTIQIRNRDAALDAPARVCWVGKSDKHGSHGVGLMLLDELVSTAQTRVQAI